MPSGKTHDAVTLWTTPGVAVLGWLGTGKLDLALLLGASYAFAGLMFSGDLDLKSVQYKRWGWFRWIWLPYQRMVSHRSPFSHGPVLGVLARLVYLSFWLLALFALWVQVARWFQQESLAAQSYALVGQGSLLLAQRLDLVGAALVGLWFGGLSHTLADEIGSRWKKARKRRSRPKKRNR